MTVDQRLWNNDRRGTLILADHRFGSHFLQAVIVDRMAGACQSLGLGLCENWTVSTPSWLVDRREIETRLELFTNGPGYSCLIVNDALEKIAIAARPDLLSRWHVIRLVREDKIKWFISYWFYLHHKESDRYRQRHRAEGFHHHNTPRDNYEVWIRNNGRMRLDGRDILDLQTSLACHLINLDIAADHEIEYEQLADLATAKVAWQANQYPSDRLEDMFENADLLEGLLKLWNRTQVKGRLRGHAT